MLCIEQKTGFDLNDEVVRESAPYILIQVYIHEQDDVSLYEVHAEFQTIISFSSSYYRFSVFSWHDVIVGIHKIPAHWHFLAQRTNPPTYHTSEKRKC